MPELVAARTAYAKGRFEECEAQLKLAKSKTPGLPPVELMLSRLHFSHKRTAAGQALLEEVATEHPNHPEVYLLFGNIALRAGRYTDALVHFEKSITLGVPSGWSEAQQVALLRESFSGQAKIAERREDWFKAQVALKQLAKYRPGDSSVRDRLGAALFMLGREQEAYEQFQTASRQDANINPPEVSMAVMCTRQQKFDKAKQIFQAAIRKYPSDKRVYHEAAAAWLLMDDANGADRLAQKAAQLGLDSPEHKMQRGYIARQLGKHADAETHFSSALVESPTNFEASNQLALALCEQDEAKRSRALEIATFNARQYPKSSYALSTLGWVYYKLGRTDEALRTLQAAASQPQVRSETMYFLARTLWENGNEQDARKVAEKVKLAVEQPGLFVLRPEIRRWFAETAIN